ncbi:MAG: hypothetical protein ACT4O4_06430 [Nitrospiraceae bacterium]
MPDRTFERAAKRSKSHAYANSFAEALRRNSDIKIIEEGNANANYFCAEVSGTPVAISPLASHEGWWEKPSDGFAHVRKGLGCKWGVVLLALGKSEVDGFWITGPDFERLLGHHSKIHSDDVVRAERRGQAHRFKDFEKFVELLEKW